MRYVLFGTPCDCRKEDGAVYVAFRIGVSQSLYCKAENGQIRPTLSLLEGICTLYNISLTDFLGKSRRELTTLVMDSDSYKNTKSFTGWGEEADQRPVRGVRTAGWYGPFREGHQQDVETTQCSVRVSTAPSSPLSGFSDGAHPPGPSLGSRQSAKGGYWLWSGPKQLS